MQPQSYISIQYLRAIAALMVVCFHLHSGGAFVASTSTDWLASGVDIFFVISGFIMVRSTQGRGRGAREFFVKRLIRIVPLYWLLTCLAIAMNGALMTHNVASFLFVPALHPEFGKYWPILEPGWTLNFEMFFYLVFGLTFAMSPRRQLACIAGFFALLVAAGMVLKLPGALNFYTNPLLFEFVAGMALAQFGRQLPAWTGVVGCALLIGLNAYDLPRIISFGVPAAIIVSSMLSAESLIPRINAFKLVGDSSYAIYLVHFFTLGTAQAVWLQFFVVNYGFMVFAVGITIVISIMLHIGFERPVTRGLSAWAGKFLSERNQPIAVSA
jgi:exopolysaccharide production protein ExoZ